MTQSPAADYARISKMVDQIMATRFGTNDQTRIALLICRAAMLRVRDAGGARLASEAAYRLGDELVGEDG